MSERFQKLVENELENIERSRELIELRELRKMDLILKKRLKLSTRKYFELIEGNNKQSKSDFFNRYHTNPYFKEKHNKFMSEKVNCKKCGQMVARNYMTRHNRTKKCLNKNLEIKKIENREKENTEINLLKNQNKLLKKILKNDIKI